jgi:excisionase family DNA binding protein
MSSEASTIIAADPTIIGPLYTTHEVATMLRVNQRTVQEWSRTGALTAVRYGRLLRIRQADLATFGEVLPRRPPPAEAEAEARVCGGWWRGGPRRWGVAYGPADRPQCRELH